MFSSDIDPEDYLLHLIHAHSGGGSSPSPSPAGAWFGNNFFFSRQWASYWW